MKISPILDASEQAARREAMTAAARSCDIEGLPPPSDFACALYQCWIDGKLTTDEVAARLVAHHRCRVLA